MASSRIEQIIEEIEEYIDSCKFQPLSSTKIVVNKEELEELLRELRMKTPDEIKRYQKIISNKDAILEDAQQKADAIIADANTQAQKIVSESEVMRIAVDQSRQLIEETNAQAQEIMDRATEDSNNIRMSAIRYTDDMLGNLEKIMSHTIDTAGTKYSNFINSLQSCYDIVSKNRSELSPSVEPSSYTQPEEEEPSEQPSEE
ncbi:MAG: ATPase [Lachnospiraceae bacterium]|nr:ATPase [Lachnospiraceae bacterium]MCD7833037.1 ATPase [Lachnospiraceae bacterium]MCD8074154.1 ATPase [Lachnospiraceae bacterium]